MKRTISKRAAAQTTPTEDKFFDHRLFILDDKTYKQFVAILDAPAKSKAGIRRLVSRKAPWER